MSAGTLQIGAPADIVRRYKYAGFNHGRRSAAWHSREKKHPHVAVRVF
jgi:hypothetical protein